MLRKPITLFTQILQHKQSMIFFVHLFKQFPLTTFEGLPKNTFHYRQKEVIFDLLMSHEHKIEKDFITFINAIGNIRNFGVAVKVYTNIFTKKAIIFPR